MDSHHNALPCDFAFWSYVPPLVVDSATMWPESAGDAQPALDFGVSFLQDIGWDSVATLQNPFQDGVIHAGVETTSAAAFDMAFNYSDSHPAIYFVA